MIWLLIGTGIAALLLLLLHWWANADTHAAKMSLLWGIGALCVVVGLVLAANGRSIMVIPLVGYTVWRMFGRQAAGRMGSGGRRPPRPGTMSREEAYDVLGLKPGAREEEINAAYRKLMARNHPDIGGSDWMAAKLNEARQTLLGK